MQILRVVSKYFSHVNRKASLIGVLEECGKRASRVSK
jgi:hypothetical protein